MYRLRRYLNKLRCSAPPSIQNSRFSWPPSAFDEVRTSTPTDTVNAGYSARHKQPATTLPITSDSHNSSSFDPTPGPAPNSKIAPARPASSTGTKIATVSSFLAGLDSALVPLASHLVDAGIDSIDSLTTLACLSADVRRALLTSLHDEVAARDPQCPSPLRLLPLFPH